ncbi:ejaculatory bulb-specific protein 3-like [Bacillus rossius redtenbacheri]|uniref:ejaculatory bulb-specific protein 3-like n=1 Tax=Bacillus rossius redtenbacheri TaxID=93214 RepID=UPI002FDE46CE
METPMVLVVLVVLAVMGSGLADNKYTTKYDNVDLDEILNSNRLLTFYVDCLLGKTNRCSPDAKELKANLPDALLSECSKCSEKQKAGAEKVINFLIEKKPELWRQLEAKFDPQGTYHAKYRSRLTTARP